MTTLVIGVGNASRGDDAAGLLVTDLLRATPHLVLRPVEGDPSSILTDPMWDLADHVVLVDSVVTGAPPGTIFSWDAAEALELMREVPAGTHDLGVVTTVQLAAALTRLPRDLTVVGIEGANFEHGEPPSHAVIVAAERVAAAIDVKALLDSDRPDLEVGVLHHVAGGP